MNLIRQPRGSSLCGQACIATICEVSLDEACKMVGTKGYTTTKRLIQALTMMGMSTGSRLKRGMPESGLAILKVTRFDGRSHWVIWKNGKFYDPAAGVFRGLPSYLQNSKVTSHLRIERT